MERWRPWFKDIITEEEFDGIEQRAISVSWEFEEEVIRLADEYYTKAYGAAASAARHGRKDECGVADGGDNGGGVAGGGECVIAPEDDEREAVTEEKIEGNDGHRIVVGDEMQALDMESAS